MFGLGFAAWRLRARSVASQTTIRRITWPISGEIACSAGTDASTDPRTRSPCKGTTSRASRSRPIVSPAAKMRRCRTLRAIRLFGATRSWPMAGAGGKLAIVAPAGRRRPCLSHSRTGGLGERIAGCSNYDCDAAWSSIAVSNSAGSSRSAMKPTGNACRSCCKQYTAGGAGIPPDSPLGARSVPSHGG